MKGIGVGASGDESTLAGLLLAQVERSPNAVALSAGAELMTYGRLGVEAKRIAASLRQVCDPEDRLVAVVLPRGIDAVVAIVGVVLSGAGYVIVDPQDPGTRSRQLLFDADP